MILPLLLASRALAADVLLPEATPLSLDDFSVAYMVYDLVLNEVGGGMYRIEDADRIRVWAGKDADGCFDDDRCPANLWDRTDARVALVLGVGQTDGGILVTARFYDATHAEPIRELSDTIPAGTELAFAKDVAMALGEVIVTVPARVAAAREPAPAPPPPPPPDPVVVDAEEDPDLGPARAVGDPAPSEELGAEDEDEPPRKTGKVDREPEPTIERPRRAEDLDDSPVTKERRPSRSTIDEDEEEDLDLDRRRTSEEPREEVDPAERELEERDLPSTRELRRDADEAEAERARMHIPEGAYRRFVASGKSEAEWRKDARVRDFGVFIEAAGGFGAWDTDRAYGVWVDLDEQDGNYVTTAASTWEGSGTGGEGGGLAALGTVGVTITWWIEASVSAGIQQGHKYLEAGYECTACEETLVEVPFDPVTGTQLWVQPRLRVLPVVTGYLKPYVLVSADMAFYDGFVPDTDVVDFPNADGGMNFGVALGAGLAIDVLPNLSIFAEVPVSVTLSPLWRSYDDPGVATQPEGIPGTGAVIRYLGGVGVHF